MAAPEQPGPDINVSVTEANNGDIQTVSPGLTGEIISSTGGDGGKGGNGYGVDIPGAPGGPSGKGGAVTLNSSVKITTNGADAYGIFAKSSAGTGGPGGTGYIASGGGGGGSPSSPRIGLGHQ